MHGSQGRSENRFPNAQKPRGGTGQSRVQGAVGGHGSHLQHYRRIKGRGGDWNMLQKYSGFEFNDEMPQNSARVEYQNMMYLERPGCNLCMGNQEKAEKGDTVMATSTRLFQGRVVEDSERQKKENPCSRRLRRCSFGDSRKNSHHG